MEDQQQQPLLSKQGRAENGEWSSHQYVGRTGSVRRPPLSGSDLTAEEIRSASFSDSSSSYYPPSIHAALVDAPPQVHHLHQPQDQAIVFRPEHGGNHGGISNVGRQTLDEVEIRQLLIDHVGHRCCWGSMPARRWRISAIEDCNVYVGTLETFLEERETIQETQPYRGSKIDGKDNGPELGLWELDLRSDFPLLFVPLKETTAKIPHSEAVTKCSDCKGRGKIPCRTCNIDQEPGHYKENQMTRCPVCHGRGLIAHKDGSDTVCGHCSGKGMLPCVTCGSRGLVECGICEGQGSLLKRNTAHVRWRTLTTRKVTAASGAASVPDEVFHGAKGVELYNTQAYQCIPASFADSYFLNKFSSDVVANRPHIPSAARTICERHVISVVPVTRVIMAHRNKAFNFYIIGLGRDVYIKNYPSRFCWGLCCCLEWVQV